MLSKEEIVIIAMIFSTLVIVIWKFIQYQYQNVVYDKRVNRTNYLKELAKSDKIPMTLINLDQEPTRIAPTDNNNGLMVDKKIYNNKNAIFLEEDGRIYILGKKEDFVIVLVGQYNKGGLI